MFHILSSYITSILSLSLSDHAYCLESLTHPLAQDKRHVLSKQFRRYLDAHQRQIFSGPPENTRDFVMAAAQALAAGDWQVCFACVLCYACVLCVLCYACLLCVSVDVFVRVKMCWG